MVFTKTLSNILLILYYMLDHPLYFAKIGFYKMDPAFLSRLDWWADFMWFAGNILDIMGQVVELHNIQREIQTAKGSEQFS